MPSESTSLGPCGTCGLARIEGGVCPRCLLRGAVARGAREEDLPRQWGRYLLRDICGSGGMGVVYRAYDGVADRTVALKMLHARELADDDALRRFLDEGQRASSLRHNHIVRVLDVGEHEGTHFFTMDFVDGLSLADRVAEFQGRPSRAALLVDKVADAVHHAHQRLLIHRDLKPANIIMDGDEPRLVDFGVAHRIGAPGAAENGGTLQSMAPEQLDPRAEQTIAVDVYGLGTILYELLCGRPPFEATTSAELIEKIAAGGPVSPRSIDGRIDKDLERICLKCLARDPADRYQSAAGLCRDLERHRRGEAVVARPLSRPARIGRWVARNPAPTTLASTALVLLVAIALAAVSVAREQETELRAEVLQANAFAARALSGAVLFEIRTLADELERLAAEPFTDDALVNRDDAALARFRQRVEDGTFDSVFLFDPAGIGVARVPAGTGSLIGVSSKWRDYFAGAARLGELGRPGVYVSRAYRSRETGTARVSLSAPVFDDEGRWRGVVQAAIETAEVFGRLDARSDTGGARIVTLLGRADRDAEDEPLREDWLVLLHDHVARGSVHSVRSKALSTWSSAPEGQLTLGQVSAVDEGYLDPVPGFAGPWLAGVAPVGGTDLAVVVQTHERDAVAANRRLGERVRAAVVLAGATALLVVLALAVGLRLRRRSDR